MKAQMLIAETREKNEKVVHATRQKWSLTQTAFDRLLACLDSDRDIATQTDISGCAEISYVYSNGEVAPRLTSMQMRRLIGAPERSRKVKRSATLQRIRSALRGCFSGKCAATGPDKFAHWMKHPSPARGPR